MFKKIIAAACMVASAAFAQISVGGHAGVDMNTFWGDDAENAASGFGFNAGVSAKVTLPGLPLAIVPEVTIDMRNYTQDEDADVTLTEWALDIPVLARFSVIPAFYVEAGPMIALNLSVSEEIDGNEVDIPDDFFNTFEFGLVFGVGTSIVPNMDIDFRMNLGITNWFQEQKFMGQTLEIDASNMQFALGVTYWFM